MEKGNREGQKYSLKPSQGINMKIKQIKTTQVKAYLYWTKPNLYHFRATFDSCDVIQMRKMRGEVGLKIPKIDMENPSFYYVTGIKCGTDLASSLYCIT